MRKNRITKKHIPTFYFAKVPKRRKELEKLLNVPIILEMKNGDFYAGILDEYEAKAVILYGVQKVKEIWEKGQKFSEIVWEPYSEKNFVESYLEQYVRDIKNIYCPKDKSLKLDQILNLTINPWYGSNQTVDCQWPDGGKHASECNDDLHESLAKLIQASYKYYKLDFKKKESSKKTKEINQAFETIHRFIVEHGEKIP